MPWWMKFLTRSLKRSISIPLKKEYKNRLSGMKFVKMVVKSNMIKKDYADQKSRKSCNTRSSKILIWELVRLKKDFVFSIKENVVSMAWNQTRALNLLINLHI